MVSNSWVPVDDEPPLRNLGHNDMQREDIFALTITNRSGNSGPSAGLFSTIKQGSYSHCFCGRLFESTDYRCLGARFSGAFRRPCDRKSRNTFENIVILFQCICCKLFNINFLGSLSGASGAHRCLELPNCENVDQLFGYELHAKRVSESPPPLKFAPVI
jgi:hypothetical protein